MTEAFAQLVDSQEEGHCGPTSLASCLCLLGIDTNQHKVARATGKSRSQIVDDGLDEAEIKRAARKYRVKSEFVTVSAKSDGQAFLGKLKAHIAQGLPAILLVDDYCHWVAVLGAIGNKFVVMDPDAENEFGFWSDSYLIQRRAWNREEDEGGDQYFAILLSRMDGKKAAYSLDKEFLRLNSNGSVEQLKVLRKDLHEVAARSSPQRRRPGRGVLFLADLLAEVEGTILEAVNHWVAYQYEDDPVSPNDLRALMRDYRVVATSSAGIRVPVNVDREALVAQMTALVTTYAWMAELDV